ncbi:hypothetical protein Curi_c28230 [Gottschalkia acidurici 9a]|uniref:DUF1643 domain-containing protein n=1 Tax=Gottschalkia acidurici (strain ATCC 7906 / DSM 604 / BCRC 14475 / CIP 104303 / KCTC 5404 / NCIMB 10678 / 9a) TaxID=1128398 RepID=K0B4F5_GOTA9|nr:DUF1643 domain-containing protein [Gottschalkia acidurici]AFS79815.1 hypothetical protein Curi_c28230 [Gottschalkia acidurici 9a]
MLATEKSIIRTEAIFSGDRLHRYLLRKEWDKNKKKSMVIMINPSSADGLIIDHTTMYVVNNLSKLEFGSVDIVNIFSKINIRISTKDNTDGLVDGENDSQILKSAIKVDSIIIAWGKVDENNKKIKERQEEVLKLLEEHKDKFYIIEDSIGRAGFHPLAPQIRFGWNLKKISLEMEEKQEEENK